MWPQSTSGRIHLVLEHAGHTLARELTFRPRGLPHPLVLRIAWQVLCALGHLHARQVGLL
jgi:cyclin-dependent kinase-like